MAKKGQNKDYIDLREMRKDMRKARDNRSDEQFRSPNLFDSPMMTRLIETMDAGEDVGHYGRLVFVMVARFFLSDDEMLALLRKQPDFDDKEASVMIAQVKERGYNPPKRERILQWQDHQDFKICPEPEDPNGCNVYRDLQFPDEIYDNIEDFWEEKVEADENQKE